MNPIVPPSMPAAAWIGSGDLGYGTPLGVACCGLALAAARPRVWRLR